MICPSCKSTQVQKRGYTKSVPPKHKLRCMSDDHDPLFSRWFTAPLGPTKNIEQYTHTPAQIKDFLKESKVFIISSVQVNTKLNAAFWANVKRYLAFRKAKLILLPVRYMWQKNKTEAWFDGEVVPHLYENEIQLHEKLRVLGQVQVSATRVNPIGSLDSLTKDCSGIVGHGQIQSKTVATPQSSLPKIMTSTGSISEKNYTPTPAGVLGAFHHSPGFVIVELDGPRFHIRNVTGDNKGEFYDMEYYVSSKGVKVIPRIEGLVTGDEHQWWMDRDVADATYFNEDSVVKRLRPKKIVRHDISDSFSISHHHRHDIRMQFIKYLNQMNSLEDELYSAATFINESTPELETENYIVASNHHEHVLRWLNEVDWRQDLTNARVYHQMWGAIIEAAKQGELLDPFVWWMKQHVTVPCVWLERDEPVTIKDILVSMHGDLGPNGSRGSINNLKNIGVKSIIGHSHTPGINKGCYQVGTMSVLKMLYTHGPSSWLHTHAIIHPNGKRQLINIIDGRWRI